MTGRRGGLAAVTAVDFTLTGVTALFLLLYVTRRGCF